MKNCNADCSTLLKVTLDGIPIDFLAENFNIGYRDNMQLYIIVIVPLDGSQTCHLVTSWT